MAKTAPRIAIGRLTQSPDGTRRASQDGELVHVIVQVLVRCQLQEVIEAIFPREVAGRQCGTGIQTQPAGCVERDPTLELSIGSIEEIGQIELSVEQSNERKPRILERGHHGWIVAVAAWFHKRTNPRFVG